MSQKPPSYAIWVCLFQQDCLAAGSQYLFCNALEAFTRFDISIGQVRCQSQADAKASVSCKHMFDDVTITCCDEVEASSSKGALAAVAEFRA